MAKVLLLKSSMTEEGDYGSISTKALYAWMHAYKEANPQDEFIKINLNTSVAGTEVLTSQNFKTFWDNSDEYIDALKKVDKLVIATPMTNFNYSAPLKNYIDHVFVAGKTFQYKYDGEGKSEGLLKNLKVQLITSQGAPKGWYPFGDHTANLKGTWEFAGATVVKPLVIAGTKTKKFKDFSSDEIVAVFEEEILESARKF